MNIVLLLLCFLQSIVSHAKEIALTFDDAPTQNTSSLKSHERTKLLIKTLKELNITVGVFANPCKRSDVKDVIAQLKLYREEGHFVWNHSCSHYDFQKVGYQRFSMDAEKGDLLLYPLLSGQKYFRFPYLHESEDEKTRDQMRSWMLKHEYRNGYVSVDNDDYLFSYVLNEAIRLKKDTKKAKLDGLFVEHLMGAVNFYDDLAIKTLGYSPKHVLLLHEVDMTVMNLGALVKELRKQGWKIISPKEAYEDKLYLNQPKNTFSNNGIVAQVHFEKTGIKIHYQNNLKEELNKLIGL